MAKPKTAKKPATKKSASKATPGSAQAAAPQRSENPMDWLYDNPLGSYPDFVFAILKQSYNGFRNSVVEFGGRKLRPVEGRKPDGSPDPDAVTAYRIGTVLPQDAPDGYDDVFTLLAALDQAACPQEPALLIYLTLAFPDARRLHHGWEAGRAFCYSALAFQRKLPVALCQHHPGLVGSDNPAHLHLLISPRRLDGTGFRGYASDLLCDDGQRILFEEWTAFRDGWGGAQSAQPVA